MPSRQARNHNAYRYPRIGGPLKQLLDERFITQRELARELDVDVAAVSRWCRNETGPYKSRLRQIAKHFGVEPAALIETSDDEPVVA